MSRGFNNSLDPVKREAIPRGCAEVWRLDSRSGNWYGPEVHAEITFKEARALLVADHLLVRWSPPLRAADVLLARSERLVERFKNGCTVGGCDRPAKGRELCEVHYSRVRRAEVAERERALSVEGDW